jgi:hypothetical protein
MFFLWSRIFLCLLGLIALNGVLSAPVASLENAGEFELDKRMLSFASVAAKAASKHTESSPSVPKPAKNPPAKPANAPKISADPKEMDKITSYSGTGKTYADAVKTSADGFKDMSQQHATGPHKDDPNAKKPGIVSALNTPNGESRLHSSKVGGYPAEANKDPEHIMAPQTKSIMNACEQAHGGKHGTGGNCGEIRNADSYFKAHPKEDHIPPNSDWAAHGHYGTDRTTDQPVPACSGSGTHNWGCKQFKEMAQTPAKDRPAKIKEHQDARGVQPAPEKKPKAEKKPEAEDGWTVVQKKKGRRAVQAAIEEEYLALLRRNFATELYDW